eukprot:CAMPEP_0195648184 /NCGR_PEP_ID=MMETSP0815-20121206/30500_1 /TAXON_ID=97485 /ORGANISM="Prymnesium parvum, Strain Texoma1" /LENGTH=169 /DNA_ID=CAMNT_0040791809 /DNA_START=433 /DNA_END=939 /DNA_ORIENTATION=+
MTGGKRRGGNGGRGAPNEGADEPFSLERHQLPREHGAPLALQVDHSVIERHRELGALQLDGRREHHVELDVRGGVAVREVVVERHGPRLALVRRQPHGDHLGGRLRPAAGGQPSHHQLASQRGVPDTPHPARREGKMEEAARLLGRMVEPALALSHGREQEPQGHAEAA